MVLRPAEAHLLCAAIVMLDLLARACRIRWYLTGLGHPIPLSRAFLINSWGDAAAGLSPMRFGGEAARLGGMLYAGVPATAAFVALAVEVLVAYPLVIGFGGWLIWRYAPDWWVQAGPDFARHLREAWPLAAVVLAVTVLVGAVAWRWKAVAVREPGRSLHRLKPAWRSMPRWPVVLGVPTSLINVVGRTLLLPVLALSLAEHPPVGVLLVGSFVLLYSQLMLPTPAGAGVVDLALLGGAAGHLGNGAGLLVAWRFYSVGAGALLGVVLALHLVGLRPLLRAVRRVAGRSPPG